ncbi:MAG: hypothetical protein WC856_21115 [Methylococcaceae bacterium]
MDTLTGLFIGLLRCINSYIACHAPVDTPRQLATYCNLAVVEYE